MLGWLGLFVADGCVTISISISIISVSISGYNGTKPISIPCYYICRYVRTLPNLVLTGLYLSHCLVQISTEEVQQGDRKPNSSTLLQKLLQSE